METINKTAPATQQPDQNTTSLDLMNRMKMHGMAEAFRESLAGTTAQSMTPDSFLSMLLHREWDWRAQAATVSGEPASATVFDQTTGIRLMNRKHSPFRS